MPIRSSIQASSLGLFLIMENRRHGYKSFTQINKWHEKNLFVYSGSGSPYFTTFFTILLQKGYQPECLVQKHYFP